MRQTAPDVRGDALAATPWGFAMHYLNLPLYTWQKRFLNLFLGVVRGEKVKGLLVTCNESGKTTHIAVPLALWWLTVFPNSIVVDTSGSYMQVREQFWPVVRGFKPILPGWEINATDLDTPWGSRMVGYSTNDPGKFEGWHKRPGQERGPLLMIIDEGKTVVDEIYDAVERCHPEGLLVMSSYGGPVGRFHQMATDPKWSKFYARMTVTADLCPHIDKQEMAENIEKYGRNHPLVRSMYFAEPMLEGESDEIILPMSYLIHCIENPPMIKQAWDRRAFCDFARSGDENVIAVREGNKLTELICWRDKNILSVESRFRREFTQLSLEAEQIEGDEGGIGAAVLDMLEAAGFEGITRTNNGATAGDKEHFASQGMEDWERFASLVRKNQIDISLIAYDDLAKTQIAARKRVDAAKGKINLESKKKRKTGEAHGGPSLDRADAIVGVFRSYEQPVNTLGKVFEGKLHMPIEHERDEEERDYPPGTWAG